MNDGVCCFFFASSKTVFAVFLAFSFLLFLFSGRVDRTLIEQKKKVVSGVFDDASKKLMQSYKRQIEN